MEISGEGLSKLNLRPVNVNNLSAYFHLSIFKILGAEDIPDPKTPNKT